MAAPGCTNSNLIIWLRCKLCGGSFLKLSEFIQHKQQWHLAHFQRTNSHSIVFEEVIPNGSQEQSSNDFQIERTQVDSAAEISELQFAQDVQVRKNSEEDVSASSVSVTVSQYGNTNEEEKEIAQLITFDENVEHQVDVAYQDINDDLDNPITNIVPRPNPSVSKLQKTKCSNFKNSTDSDPSSNDTIANASLPQVRLKRLTLQQIETAINYSTRKNCKTTRSTNSQKVICSPLFKKNSCVNTASNTSLIPNFKLLKCVNVGCFKKFNSRYNCKRHSTTYCKYRPGFTSKTNKKVFKKSKRLQSVGVAEKWQEPARPFSCSHPQCSLRFTSKSLLKRHIETHLNDVDRPVFVCEICKVVFWYKGNLKKHCSVFHHGRRPDRRIL